MRRNTTAVIGTLLIAGYGLNFGGNCRADFCLSSFDVKPNFQFE
jgi:hypothetical protein